MAPTGTFKLVPPVNIPFPLLLELFSAAPVTFPGNNLLLCFGEAQPLFLHSVLLMRAQGARRESSRKWEGASGARLELPRPFDVPWPNPTGSSWCGRGLLPLPIPPVNPTWGSHTASSGRARVVMGLAAKPWWYRAPQCRQNERKLSAGIVSLRGCWKEGKEVTC